MSLRDAVYWWFTFRERDVQEVPFGREVSFFVLDSTSCHMFLALAGGLRSDKRSLRQGFSALPSPAPWHTSLLPGGEQPAGCSTKAPLPVRVIGVSKRRIAVNGSNEKKKKDLNFCTLPFHLLTPCSHTHFGENEGTWNDQAKYA